MILDGKKLRDELLEKYKEKIAKDNLDITLAIIEVGNNEASNIYVNNKIKYCSYVGIKTKLYKLEDNVSEEELVNLIDKLNKDNNITGIILQSPISKTLDYDYISNKIESFKDVDGFTKDNVYNLYLKRKSTLPCTVKGIIVLLEHYNIPLDGANVVIVGRGNIVGKPLALALSNLNATVTLCHSHTKNLGSITKNADIVISATGVPNLITKDMVSNSSVVVDVGINRIDGKIIGDVSRDVRDITYAITPNPGGVGPMTIAMIIDNLIEMKEGRNG